ncbi:MAG: helix-hairpin-helix domain-containing protein [Paludibacteraceae bacterium]|nr:helix-hairpin-helix domain-containing protein [Paludibacteraceae bacterium]
MKSIFAVILLVANLSLDEIILDIYRGATEVGEVDYEQLQTDLYALHETPIDLNNTSEEELSQLLFLSPQQIDELLAYADKHPFESLYELRLISSLTDYQIRNLLPFVEISRSRDNETTTIYPKELFAHAQHEIIARVDARNIEAFEGTDPVYVQTRYRFDYQRRVVFGAQLRRPAGMGAQGLEWGAYLQLRDIGCLHTLVAGNFQASFGQGLVFAPVFHTGKSAYVQSVGQTTEGLRYYSSVDGEGLHGAGATFRKNWSKATRLDASVLYSLKRANDSTWQHIIGANLTLRHKRLQVELTAAEKIYSDSIRPYRNTGYNQHYFRGYNQAVIGISARYNYGWFDLFTEVATTQNKEWGFGTLVGSRFYPTDGVSLVALYRYYSPWFDNDLGYAFSETSRLGDENGGYLGFDVTRLKRWRFSGYADVFYFSGVKYGIPYSPSLGYDAMAEVQYHSPITNYQSPIIVLLRLRARKKGDEATYSARFQFDWAHAGWSLRTTADANLTNQSTISNLQSQIPYGFSLAQDIGYAFSQAPVALKGRLQFFDAREWANRIYMYEQDVLYAFSVPAVYGLGGRAYLCFQWQIIPQLALYFRALETIYQPAWASAHNRPTTRTDLHLLLRAKL